LCRIGSRVQISLLIFASWGRPRQPNECNNECNEEDGDRRCGFSLPGTVFEPENGRLRIEAYIGNFGFDLSTNAPLKPAEIIMVTPDGKARIVAEALFFPNGMIITPDGQTLVVAETWGNCLTAFDIQLDGSLARRRTWAKLDGAYPDGICLDAEGAIWVAAPSPGEVLRVNPGGNVTHSVKVSTKPYACMLGGHDRRTLIVCTADPLNPDRFRAEPNGKIEMVEVEVPGAGLP
jgi:sugar lactone lactonase YvrE